MATFCCSLCLLAIPSDKHRNKRKLHGTSPLAAKVKLILRALSPVPLEGLQDPRSVLCSKYEKTLVDISKLEDRLKVLKKEVLEKIQKLDAVASHEMTTSLPECSECHPVSSNHSNLFLKVVA